MKRKKRQLERRYLSTKLTSDHIAYKYFCKEYYRKNAISKIFYNRDKLADCRRDQKKIFALSKRLLGSRPVVYPKADSDEQLANNFINFFVAKSGDVYKELLSYQRDKNDQIRTTVPTLQSFDLPDEDEVVSILRTMPNKQCQFDPIPTWILKKYHQNLSPTITRAVRLSLMSSTVPKSLKRALIRPILKKPSLDSSQLKNYRPVSNLPVLSKIIEKVVFKRLDAHCLQNNLLDPNQSAYRKLHSTETALLRVNNDILQQLDRGRITALVTIDVSAAFDTVNHQSLLDRLQYQFGVSDTAYQWMESYLTGREQCVIINSAHSKMVNVDHGFPQGAILAGMLYNAFSKPIGDVTAKYSQVDHNAYADDNGCYISFCIDNQTGAINDLVNCVHEIGDWMNQNFLKINDDKTETILFLPNKQAPVIQSGIQIRTELVKPVTSVDYLGVTLDNVMRMERQINNVTKTAYYHIRRITKVRKYLDTESTKTLIQSLVISRLDYCNSLFINLPKHLIQKLQKVQNYCARVIYRKKKRTRTTPLLRKLHWLPLLYRIKFKVLLVTFKCVNGLAPRYLSSLLTLYRCPRTLRSNSRLTGTLNVPRFKKRKHGGRTFATAAPSLWNSIPVSIRTVVSVSEFKSKLKTYFFSEHFGSAEII